MGHTSVQRARARLVRDRPTHVPARTAELAAHALENLQQERELHDGVLAGEAPEAVDVEFAPQPSAEDGFAPPVIAQLANNLEAAMPRVFDAHSLLMFWGFTPLGMGRYCSECVMCTEMEIATTENCFIVDFHAKNL